jgi:hypothetical protein
MTYDLPPTSSGYGQESGTGGVRDQARNLGSEAAQAGGSVAQTTKEQGREVVGEATRQARNFYGQARAQLAGQASDQQRRAAGGLHSLADEMRSMAEKSGQSGPVSELAWQAADRVHGVAGWLESREPGDLLAEVRSYARRNPGTFLIGAALLGVLAGRLTRNVAAVSTDTASRSGLAGEYQPAYAQPVADPDRTVVLPPAQPSGYAESTYTSGYGDATQPIGDSTQPIGYGGTQQTGSPESGVYGEPRRQADETDELPGAPSPGVRP